MLSSDVGSDQVDVHVYEDATTLLDTTLRDMVAAGLEKDSLTRIAAIESLAALDVCMYACVNVGMFAVY